MTTPKRKNLSLLPPIKTVSSPNVQELYYYLKTETRSPDSPYGYGHNKGSFSYSPLKPQTARMSPRKLSFHPFSFSTQEGDTSYKSLNDLKRLKKLIGSRKESTEPIDTEDEDNENSLIHRHVRTLITKFINIPLNDKLQEGYMQKLDKYTIEKIILMAEKILMLYAISPVCVYTSKIDSVIIIDPLTDNNNLAQCYRAIIPEFAKFPYTFFKALSLMTISFADEVHLNKPMTHALTQRRLHTGLFPLNNFKTMKEAKLYFYKMVAYLMRAKHITLDEEWIEITPPPKETKLVYVGTRAVPKPRDILGEQAEFLMNFLKEPRQYFQSDNEVLVAQADLFQSVMEEIDPVGINQKWWRDLANYDTNDDYF